jgi:hypothetical protein
MGDIPVWGTRMMAALEQPRIKLARGPSCDVRYGVTPNSGYWLLAASS